MLVTLMRPCEFGVKVGYAGAASGVDLDVDLVRLLACVAFVLIVVGGCGAAPGSRTVPTVSPPTGALEAWKSFPADLVPRPIVLLDELPRSPGFSTNDGKIAMMCHRFGPPAKPLPSAVPGGGTANWADGRSDTYPVISATDAYAAMSRPSLNGPGAMCNKAPLLTATEARFGMYDFATDRGKVWMSSWLFNVQGGLVAYPAVVQSAFWADEISFGLGGGGASISEDGLTLTFGFAGAPAGTGPCDANYSGVVAESSSAVAVAVQEIPSQPQSGAVACPAIAAFRTVVVKLARPLGGRVALDASGTPGPVCPARFAPPFAFGSPSC
jgi:hypothetical protein